MKDSKKNSEDALNNTTEDVKPVGYGSSIQNSGNGNRTRPTDLDKLKTENIIKNEEQSDEDVAKGHA
ncbi:MAG: hypothetical protein EOO42_07665 [Flavobacteriales bacterium]|nr:MAG: hypothetical protein EOO42_07665 [Flavobacteriales bacterium]